MANARKVCRHCGGESPLRVDNAGVPLPQRFWDKVEKTDSCWVWKASTTRGYGTFSRNGNQGYAHRYAYEAYVGPLVDGMHIDHLCRNPLCVRPDHLEQVTPRENLLRGVGPSAKAAKKTHCPQGHPYAGENLGIHRNGNRWCRTCHRENQLRRYHKKKEATNA